MYSGFSGTSDHSNKVHALRTTNEISTPTLVTTPYQGKLFEILASLARGRDQRDVYH